MTDEADGADAGGRDGTSSDAEAARAARLAALLSVDIGARERAEQSAATDDGSANGSEAADAAPDGDVAAPRRTDPAGSAARIRRLAAGGILVSLLLTGATLVYAGSRIVRSSTEGRVVQPIDDPTAPGFEAQVEPTPTLLLMHDRGGLLDGLTVLTLPDPGAGGGGVLFIPPRTVYDMPIFELNPIDAGYALSDADFETYVVSELLETNMLESVVVDDARWADLVAPVAPISLDNPNELTVDGEVRFPLGEIELGAEDVGPYLEARVEGESDLARLFRHETFWRAWLAAVAADGTPGAVPGELESGLGRFVRELAAGESVIETLPVDPAPPEAYGEEPAFVPDFEAIAALLPRLIPFPTSPGFELRARVRILNGTSDTDAAAQVASSLPPAGVEVVLIGNAATFDHPETTISYFGSQFRDEAEAVAEILGVGRVVEETRPSDVVDITVTLGADHG